MKIIVDNRWLFLLLGLSIITMLLIGQELSLAVDEPRYNGVSGTGSMEPMLYDDSRYLYHPFDSNEQDLMCGHIYVYQNPKKNDSLTIHRFVYETKDGLLIFKGDNNFVSDDPVSRDSVVQEVIGVRWD